MAHLTIRLNGVVRDDFVRYRTVRIDKRGAIESCNCEFLDHDISASALRPAVGDELHIHRGISLEFGGEVSRVTDKRLNGGMGGGTVTVVEARGWYFEAADIFVPSLSLPEQTLQESVEQIRIRYLADKGWINLEVSPGGPVVRAMSFQNTTVQAVFDALQEESGYTWRVNGDRWMAFQLAGVNVAPDVYDETNSIVLRGMTWTQDRMRRASRLFVTTGGQRQFVTHSETREGDGVKVAFPVNVLPPERSGAVANVAGYAIGATSMAISGLPPTAALKTGNVFRFMTHHPYTLTGDVTTNGDGEATIAFTPGLRVAVIDQEALTFAAGVFVTLTVGGTPTAVLGAPWSFDGEQAQHITSGAAPAVGVPIVYTALIDFPAVVRSWDASAQAADGSFDYANVRDEQLTWDDQTDVAVTHAKALVELANFMAEPKEIKLQTFAQEVYPWMMATVDFPDRLLTGTYLIQDVSLTDVGRGATPLVELTMLEGSRIGRDWRAYWMGKNRRPPYVLTTPVVPQMQWSTTGETTDPDGAAMAAVTPNATPYAWSNWVTVNAALDADSVLTAIHFLPANFWQFGDVEIGVGAPGAEAPIASVPLYFYGGQSSAPTSGECVVRFPIPIDALPVGSRVAARIRKDGVTVATWGIAISRMRKPLTGNLQTTVVTTKSTGGGAAPPTVGTSAITAWSWSAWVEIIASASADLALAGVQCGPILNIGSYDYEIEIGVGAASAEVAINAMRFASTGFAEGPSLVVLPNPFVGIVAGNRVAVRVRKGVSHGTGLPTRLWYYELPL